MLIRSNFKDCYDNVQQFGIDNDVVYDRRTIRIDSPDCIKYIQRECYYHIAHKYRILDYSTAIREIKALEVIIKTCDIVNKEIILDSVHIVRNLTSCVTYKSSNKKDINDMYIMYKSLLFFCGRLYPLIAIVKNNSYFYKSNIKYNDVDFIYTSEKLDKYIEDNKLSCDISKHEKLNKFWLNSDLNLLLPYLRDEIISNKIINTLIIFEGSARRNYKRYYNEQIKNHPNTSILDIVINPSLEEIKFSTIMNVNNIFQELDTYISGILSYPQNSMIEVSDEQKVIKHGFDPKYGFRKRKVEK